MKKVPCDFCDAEIEGETFDGWMENAKAHYGAKHGDKIANVSEEDKAKWVEKSKAQFEAA